MSTVVFAIRRLLCYTPPMKTTCTYCQVEFERPGCHVTRSKSSFCSQECYWKWRRGPNHPLYSAQQATCTYCGKVVQRRPNELARHPHSFCNLACLAAWRARERSGKDSPKYSLQEAPCDWCGKPLLRSPSGLRINRHHFCDWKCRDEWRKKYWWGENCPLFRHGQEDYGPNWPRQRMSARARDKVCQDCGASPETSGQALDVHHLTPRGDFGDDYKQANALSNLVSLCQSCHTIRHNTMRFPPKS
jgi:hypothetical protein